jgi:hypothetical protein
MPKQLRYSIGQRINQRLLKKPSMSEQTRRKLLDGYKHDISTLQELLGRSLSAWTSE